ncbi:MAG TPA: hypothetical protein VFL90_07970 [Methylomirabilota bacterium]|nr:hypothetical protein [Methylomirabilota bacterium]
MTRALRWPFLILSVVALVSLTRGVSTGADTTRVDEATRRVEHGAKQIGEGDLGLGFKTLFTGLGGTIVEGAKFTGNTIVEFFEKKPASPEVAAPTAGTVRN